jgi:riboflavin biosynthesis pyrimidine reductase
MQVVAGINWPAQCNGALLGVATLWRDNPARTYRKPLPQGRASMLAVNDAVIEIDAKTAVLKLPYGRRFA